MPTPNTISVEKLLRLVGTPKCPTLIDVRLETRFESDPRLIPSSRHRTFEALEVSAANDFQSGQPVVVICSHGGSQSQGVAAWLRDRGVAAEVLEGGFEAWRQAGLHLVPVAKLPPADSLRRTVWVT